MRPGGAPNLILNNSFLVCALVGFLHFGLPTIPWCLIHACQVCAPFCCDFTAVQVNIGYNYVRLTKDYSKRSMLHNNTCLSLEPGGGALNLIVRA